MKELGVIAHSGYAMVNFKTQTALTKCIFNHSVMTGNRTWIHSTRRDGIVPTNMGDIQRSTTRNPRLDNPRITNSAWRRSKCNKESLASRKRRIR